MKTFKIIGLLVKPNKRDFPGIEMKGKKIPNDSDLENIVLYSE
jgi:hypothetical protein